MGIFKSRIKTLYILLFCFAYVGCNSNEDSNENSSVQKISCQELISKDSCWQEALQRVASCVPQISGSGQFNASGMQCSYDSGEVIEINQSSFPELDTNNLQISISNEGEHCVDFESETEVGVSSTQKISFDGKVYELYLTMSEIRITCPDGNKYKAPSYFELAGNCGSESIDIPGSFIEQGTNNYRGLDLSGWHGPDSHNQVSLYFCSQ